jgi:predicted nucleic acid-binding protein
VPARELLHAHPPVVWWATGVEVFSAITRLRRQDVLTEPQARKATERLARLSRSWREVQPASRVRDLAERQLERFPLTAADAFQLAAALVWSNERPRRRLFFCRDQRLTEAARKAGFEVPGLA